MRTLTVGQGDVENAEEVKNSVAYRTNFGSVPVRYTGSSGWSFLQMGGLERQGVWVAP